MAEVISSKQVPYPPYHHKEEPASPSVPPSWPLLSDNHHWDLHITNITNRASKTQVFEKESKGQLHNYQKQVYKPLVKLTLECASPVWDQFTAENIVEASEVAQTTNKADHFLQTPSQRDGPQFQLHTCQNQTPHPHPMLTHPQD